MSFARAIGHPCGAVASSGAATAPLLLELATNPTLASTASSTGGTPTPAVDEATQFMRDVWQIVGEPGWWFDAAGPAPWLLIAVGAVAFYALAGRFAAFLVPEEVRSRAVEGAGTEKPHLTKGATCNAQHNENR